MLVFVKFPAWYSLRTKDILNFMESYNFDRK